MKSSQIKVKEFCEKRHFQTSPEYAVLDLTSEVGELAKEILRMSNYGRGKFVFRKEVALELGDAFYSLLTVANSLNVDLEKALEKVLKKYAKRLEKGSLNSGN